MEVIYGSTSPSLERCFKRIIAVLDQWTGVYDAPSDPCLVLGASATVPIDLRKRGYVVVPGLGVGSAPTLARGVVNTSTVVALLDETEAELLDSRHTARPPVVVTGIPAAPLGETTRGLDTSAVGETARNMARSLGVVSSDEGPGVSWIAGRGVGPIVAAVEAWAERRAVVAWPGTPRHPLLVRGGVLFASSALHAIEATQMLAAAPNLAITLARRGARAAAALPDVEAVAERLVEALELARSLSDDRDKALPST